mgnify:CR=1 FL=1
MADSNSILSSERKEKEEVIDKALRPTRLKDYAGQDGIREQLDLHYGCAQPRRGPGPCFALRASGLR